MVLKFVFHGVVPGTRRQFSVNLGTSVGVIAKNFSELKTLATLYKDSNYLLAVDLRKGKEHMF